MALLSLPAELAFWEFGVYDARHTDPRVTMRFIMNTGRTTKQGQQINVGKDHPEYQATVTTMTMHPEDMKAIGIESGSSVRARSEFGEAAFRCVEGKVPRGMIFVPYGPPTCRVMGTHTDGTGMPTSKGWAVEVEPITTTSPAWELLEPGRYMPRRIRGSFPGRALG